MKKLILLALVAISFASCGLPNDYTVYNPKDGRIYSHWCSADHKIGDTIVVDGNRVVVDFKN